MDITPWRTPDVPPKTGSSAKSKPTAQSWKESTTLNIEFQSISERILTKIEGCLIAMISTLFARLKQHYFSHACRLCIYKYKSISTYLQNQSSNYNLAMKGIDAVPFH
jgi:hypothetical protein